MKESLKFIENNIIFQSTLIVACSGGPDSMCLLSLLLKVRAKLDLTIVVAHVNHNVRPEAEAEQVFVEKYAQENNCLFETMLIKEYKKTNFHNEARLKRYEFFKNLIKKYQANYLLTAHHGDDLIETILMRIVRGTNLKGYSGFKSIVQQAHYLVLRPLIFYSKAEIKAYDEENDIPYVVDESNETNHYTRNRYRHHILPFLKKEEPLVHKKFLKFSETLLEYDEYFQLNLERLKTELFDQAGLKINCFKELDNLMQKKVLEKMLEEIYITDLFMVNEKNLKEMEKLINSKKAQGHINLPGNYLGVKSYNSFEIERKKSFQDYCLELDEITKINNGYVIKKVKKVESENNFLVRLNSEELKLPLMVRNRKVGDKISLKNFSGTKKVKDIFIDEKIPLDKRKTWPLLVDSNETVIWIPGVKKSKFDKKKNEIYDIILKYEEEQNEH